MKKFTRTALFMAGIFASTASFGQLLDEKNVTITMDLQPVLQLKMEGPDQFDFTFDEISEYYSGITKYGANILKVSASVSFDLWAVGLSQGEAGDFLWDNAMQYQGGGVDVPIVPINAFELRQFPANPVAGAVPTCAATAQFTSDYSAMFEPYLLTTNTFAAAACRNNIYTVANATPYLAPTSLGAAGSEKYIAGASGTGATCQIAGGSYLMETMDFAATGTAVAAGYFFVMDYRIVPGLPVKFPASTVASAANADLLAGQSNFDADAARTAAGLTVAGVDYTSPGVYSMYVKYILAEDQ